MFVWTVDGIGTVVVLSGLILTVITLSILQKINKKR